MSTRILALILGAALLLGEVVLAAAPAPPGATPGGSLRLEDLERKALEKNPSLSQAQSSIRAAQGRQTQIVGPTPRQMPGGQAGQGAGSRQGRVPGFPQDMWMPMDEEVTKAESYSLPKDWSAALGGMMTLVRVLPPDKYDEIMALVKEAGSDAKPIRPTPRPASPPPSGGHHR